MTTSSGGWCKVSAIQNRYFQSVFYFFARSAVGRHLFSGVKIPPETGGMILVSMFLSGFGAKYV
jgi:hypothetical protein